MLPKGLGNLGDMGGLMRQAMGFKQNLENLKAELAEEIIEASAGGGMVTVTMNGKMEVLEVKIDPEIIDRDDPEVLETMVAAALNEANRKTHETIKEKVTALTGGIDIPGLTSP